MFEAKRKIDIAQGFKMCSGSAVDNFVRDVTPVEVMRYFVRRVIHPCENSVVDRIKYSVDQRERVLFRF